MTIKITGFNMEYIFCFFQIKFSNDQVEINESLQNYRDLDNLALKYQFENRFIVIRIIYLRIKKNIPL